MYNIIALIGESGSGKDRTLTEVCAAVPSFHKIVGYTTRPIRDNEINGINYYYISKEEFEKKIINEQMLEYAVFNDWFYGAGYESLDKDKINIGVFNPDGITSLLKSPDCNVISFWIKANDKVRLIRQLNRETNPDVNEVIRRFQADAKDFNFRNNFNPIILTNDTEEDLEHNIKRIIHCSNQYFYKDKTN